MVAKFLAIAAACALLPVLCAGSRWHLAKEGGPAPAEVAGEGCDALIERYAAPPVRSSPPRQMPTELVPGYTMDGRIEVGDFFVDDTIGGKGSHYKYRRQDIDHMVKAAGSALQQRGRGGRKNEAWVVEALSGVQGHVEGAAALVFGSMEPWYEAMLVAAGAATVTTAEYNQLTYDHPQVTTVLPSELPAKLPESGGFDIALSISSFDHDGLGRYSDPLGPNNDLRAMKTARCFLKPGGIMLLTIPIGPDAVVWNLHRRYGKHRCDQMM
eukprot:COSAG05_NODE_322_length_11414_cov_47.115510_4_plen_269_part_00